MAYYRVKIWLPNGVIKTGIRLYSSNDLEAATEYFAAVAFHQLGPLTDIEVAHLSPNCTAVREYRLLNRRRSNTIPVMFLYQGREVAGILSEVFGAANSAATEFHLDVHSFYWGRLRKANGSWVFDPAPGNESLISLTDYFGKAVEAILGFDQG